MYVFFRSSVTLLGLDLLRCHPVFSYFFRARSSPFRILYIIQSVLGVRRALLLSRLFGALPVAIDNSV
ncbi:hypothetical protein M5D96_010365, partial [Drosophila gunungcola]